MKTVFRLGLCAALVTLGACATAPAGRLPPAKIDLAKFDHGVVVDEVRIDPGAATNLSGAQRASLARDLRIALMNSMPAGDLVTEARPGVLRVAINVTEIDAASPAVNAVTAALLFVPLDRGGIAFEARFFDGESKEPIAIATHRQKGTPLDLTGSFRRYGHAVGVIEDWGASLAKALEGT
jgi:hypothetical protein